MDKHQAREAAEAIAMGDFSATGMAHAQSLLLKGTASVVTLTTEDSGRFRLDRLMLVDSSPYFRVLFTTALHPKMIRTEIAIPGVAAWVLEVIVHFAQTGEAKLTADTVDQVMVEADQFDVQQLVNVCSSYLVKHMESVNCIGIYTFAQFYFFHALAASTYAFIMKNFTEVATTSDELLELPLNDITTILASDELNVHNENLVWEFVLKWLFHNLEQRASALPALLQYVRLGLVDPKFFHKEIEKHPLVAKSAECQPLLCSTVKFFFDLHLLNSGHETKLSTPELGRPRLPHEVMICICGWTSSGAGNKIESYDTRADRWVEVPEVDPVGPRAYHGCAFLGNYIYIFGGFDGFGYFNTCRGFNVVTKEWTELAPMNQKRCYVSTTILNGAIYALGGYNGHHRLSSVECYTPSTNQWTMMPPMIVRRSDSSAAVLDGKLYMIGGFDGQECLNTCEVYDPVTREWNEIGQMWQHRSGVSCAVYGDVIYAAGGFNGTDRLRTVEKYDQHTNTWYRVPSMYTCRSNFAIAVIDDLMFVMGGFNGVTTIPCVECYDRHVNMWMDATKMAFNRSGCCACVVSNIPNLKDYLYQHRREMLKSKRLPNIRSSHADNELEQPMDLA